VVALLTRYLLHSEPAVLPFTTTAMVLSQPVTVKKKSQPIHVLHRNKVRKVIALTAAAAATAVVTSCATDEKEPMHTSWQTGQRWIDELLEGACDSNPLQILYQVTKQS
jgi:hypothetical protein